MTETKKPSGVSRRLVTGGLATGAALQQYGWGVPAFVLAPITNRAFFASSLRWCERS